MIGSPVQRIAPSMEVRVEALGLGYGKRSVIAGLDLELLSGKVTAIIGPNGCGKSTLLAGLARLLTPQHGAVLLDGRALASFSTREAARRIGLLPQQTDAPDGLTVLDLVRFGRHPHQGLLRQWGSEDDEATGRALREAGLESLAHHNLDTLSGGQRQRAWIAMVVAQETPLVLLDEPTAALDLGHRLEVYELVSRLAADGRTVVMVMHDLNDSIRHADVLIAMDSGEVVASGRPDEVITPELVRRLYGVECVLTPDPITSKPLVVPVRRVPDSPEATEGE